MNTSELRRFVNEAHNIIDGYVDNLPDGVSILPAEDVITSGPYYTVTETDDSVYVLAWIDIPKNYQSICFP